MSNPPMYGSLVALDREQHKKLRLNTEMTTIDKVAGMNSMFLTAVEFADACKEFPIVFVRVGEPGKDGAPQAIAPLAVFGIKAGSNLYVKDGKWTANYAPAYMRRYPFVMARVNQDDWAVCIDADWAGFNETDGEALFNDDGQPSEFTLNAKSFLESFEGESDRTREFCALLQNLGLLREMRFEATLASGEKLDVNGFLAIDEEKLAALKDEQIVQLYRNGVLSLVEMHRVSLGNMSRLAQLQSAI